MRSFGLRPQDDEENFIIIYLTKDSPICHSERSEESHAFNEFLTQRINLSPLKRMIVSKDWIAVANRLVPVLGAGTMTLPKYRLSGSEVSEMAEYKYPDPSCASFVQFG